MYRSGPFQKGKPEQGYQLALTPKEFFSAGIDEANAWSRKSYGRDFDRLSPPDRAAALKTMEEGKAEFIGIGLQAVLRRPADHQHGRLFLRSDIRRKSQPRFLEHAGISGTASDLCE